MRKLMAILGLVKSYKSHKKGKRRSNSYNTRSRGKSSGGGILSSILRGFSSSSSGRR